MIYQVEILKETKYYFAISSENIRCSYDWDYDKFTWHMIKI